MKIHIVDEIVTHTTSNDSCSIACKYREAHWRKESRTYVATCHLSNKTLGEILTTSKGEMITSGTMIPQRTAFCFEAERLAVAAQRGSSQAGF